MSIIKVWTPKGNWSTEEVCGLDKVHLIKCAVRSGVEYICSDGEPHFELKENELIESDLIGDDLDRLDPRLYNLSESKFFLMPLVVLKRMADSELYLREVYNRLLELAEVPVGAGNTIFGESPRKHTKSKSLYNNDLVINPFAAVRKISQNLGRF